MHQNQFCKILAFWPTSILQTAQKSISQHACVLMHSGQTLGFRTISIPASAPPLSLLQSTITVSSGSSARSTKDSLITPHPFRAVSGASSPYARRQAKISYVTPLLHTLFQGPGARCPHLGGALTLVGPATQLSSWPASSPSCSRGGLAPWDDLGTPRATAAAAKARGPGRLHMQGQYLRRGHSLTIRCGTTSTRSYVSLPRHGTWRYKQHLQQGQPHQGTAGGASSGHSPASLSSGGSLSTQPWLEKW